MGKIKKISGIVMFLACFCASSGWEAEDPLQLLVVGLRDNEAILSAIDVLSGGEVSVKLSDEFGNIIHTEPLGITTDVTGNNIWISFRDKKIRRYNVFGEIQNISGTDWSWIVSSIPDGLYFDGTTLYYCSASTNKVFGISTGVESVLKTEYKPGVFLEEIGKRLSLDGVVTDNTSLNYTTQEYPGYNPTGISGQYLCSTSLSKINKRFASNSNLIQTLPPDTPIWINEQDTPSPVVGIAEVSDSSVPEGHVVYLSCTDGNIYKVRFKGKQSVVGSLSASYMVYKRIKGSSVTYDPTSGGFGITVNYDLGYDIHRYYGQYTPPALFLEAKTVVKPHYFRIRKIWNGSTWVYTSSSDPIFPTTVYICSFNTSWNTEQMYNNPVLESSLVSVSHDGITQLYAPFVKVIDMTTVMPTTPFYYAYRYGNESQYLYVDTYPPPDPIPLNYVSSNQIQNNLHIGNTILNFLTNSGSLTVLDQFTTSIPAPQGLAMGRLQIKVDVDIDSDNNNGVSPPNQSDTEDIIEETQPGKFVTVNYNDDNENGVPDYSDEAVSGEGNLVPLIIEISTRADWSNVKMTFSYPGESTLPSFTPQDMGNDFKDYTNAKKGTIRIWNISLPQDTRTGDKYIQPNREYNAVELGFSGRKIFYLEGVNPADNAKIEVTYKTQDQIAKDSVVVTIVEPNLGVNNSNNSTTLRPGIPDVNFDIDDDDEKSDDKVEDQKDGFNFWWSSDWLTITMAGIVDVAPLLIDVPKSLQDAGFKFYLKVNNSQLIVYPGVSPSANRREYLQNETTANNQITQSGILLTPGTVQRVMTQAGKNEFVFNGNGSGKVSVILSLLIEEPTTSNRVVADSVKITFRDTQDYWLFVSACGTPNVPFTYPTEDTREVEILRYPDPGEMGGTRDSAKKKHLIMVHGYNVTEEQAKDGYKKLYRRLFWLGFRGNFIGFTWDSNEGFPSVLLFDTQVQNAFQTSPSFQWFLQNRVLATTNDGWGVSPSDIDIMVHSLGNLVVFDGLRLHRRLGTGQLVRNVISFESATWPEAYQAEEEIVYEHLPNSDAITYPLDQLKRHSWAFWFMQEGFEAKGAINGKIYHSYLPDDPVLAIWMRRNDYLQRGLWPREWHYWRNKLVRGGNYRAPEGQNNLHSIIPTLMLMENRNRPPYRETALNLPVGTMPNPMAGTNNYFAPAGGWMPPPPENPGDLDAHSRFLTERFPQIYKWYRIFLAGQGNPDDGEQEFDPAIPIGEE